MLFRGSFVGQASGSSGGITASRNRYGAYLRSRSVPVNPSSTRQQIVRANFASIAAAWAGLSSASREAWASYADQTPVVNKLGDTVLLSGQAMYQGVNSFLLTVGGSTVGTPPTTPGLSTLGAITSVTLAEGSDFSLTVATTGNTATAHWLVQYGPSVSPGVSYFKGPFSQFAVIDTVAATGPSAEVITFSSGRWGVPAASEIRPLRIKGVDGEGKLSNAWFGFVTIT